MRFSIVLRDTIKSIQKLIKHDLNILERDKFVVRVRAGNGGVGLPRYDGCGGRGGSVFFIPKREMAFSDIPKIIGTSLTVVAKSGESAMKTKLIGKDANDTYVEVPFGVEIVNEETGILIARCDKQYNKYLIAKGGNGGRRDNLFRLEKGESLRLSIHLKLRPNIALLGFPNAGKSTLMKALVPSKSVKIGSYAFTTTRPQMAFWKSESIENKEEDDSFTLSIADLPGIIEGSSRNRGRGFSFLKHLEYADIIVIVVDYNGFQLKNDLSEPYRNALECIALLNKEIETYDDKILSKTFILVINKIDLCKDEEDLNRLISILRSSSWYSSLPSSFIPSKPFKIKSVIPCSAKKGEINELRLVLKDCQHVINSTNKID